ncbi:recombinase family protein [Escherichia coli]
MGTFGYVRVSSKDQNESRQIEALKTLVDEILIDKASGKNADRPALKELMRALLQIVGGDKLIIPFC